MEPSIKINDVGTIPEWGAEQELSNPTSRCVCLTIDIDGIASTIAYGIVIVDKGFYLNGQSISHIKHLLEWLEVKEEYRGKGYGRALVSHIRDSYMAMETPICFIAHHSVEFYSKLGAILLIDEDSIYDNVMAFMRLYQVEKFYPEGSTYTIAYANEIKGE